MHLWEAKHSYYCEEANYFARGPDQPGNEYLSWADFFEAEGDSDPDMNLLFRWDWREADPDETSWGNKEETLMLYWMGQRKGLYRWTAVRVSKDDEPAIRKWLTGRLEHLLELWAPLDV